MVLETSLLKPDISASMSILIGLTEYLPDKLPVFFPYRQIRHPHLENKYTLCYNRERMLYERTATDVFSYDAHGSFGRSVF